MRHWPRIIHDWSYNADIDRGVECQTVHFQSLGMNGDFVHAAIGFVDIGQYQCRLLAVEISHSTAAPVSDSDVLLVECPRAFYGTQNLERHDPYESDGVSDRQYCIVNVSCRRLVCIHDDVIN